MPDETPHLVEPAKLPRKECPFTGKTLEIVHHEGLDLWQARGEFYTTKWFKEKRELFWFLSHRDGVAPSFPRAIKIEVVGEQVPPPSDPGKGLGPIRDTEDRVAEILSDAPVGQRRPRAAPREVTLPT